MDIVVISSDSSNPPSPTQYVSSGCVERSSPSEVTEFRRPSPIRKKFIHNFSSSDDSDTECSPDFENRGSTSETSFTKKSIEPGNGSDIEHNIVEMPCTEEGYVLPNVNEFLNYEVDKVRKDCGRATQNKGSKPSKKKLSEEEREKRMKEKEEKKVEMAREKALKKATSEAQKANRPGECLKHIQAQIDQGLLTEEFSGDLLLALQSSQMQYNIQEQLSEKSVTWVKTVYNYQYNDKDELIVIPTLKEENLVLTIVTSSNLIELIREKKLRCHLQKITQLQKNKKVILVIYKLEKYYKLQAIEKQRKFKAQCRKGSGGPQENDVAQHMSRTEIEKALIEIQIFENCSHRFVETPQDLGSLVAQFTKALAEKDFKFERQQKERENLGWFASGDSRDTVKVDKNGNGLIRLWKQQLCQFNTASLDTSDAIISLYPSPKSLIEAYENCSTKKEGQLLLENITVRRGAGPLTSVRRIGPELSKKIYNFFTARNGDVSLSQD